MTTEQAISAESNMGDKYRSLIHIKQHKKIILAEIKKKELQNAIWEDRRQEKLKKGRKVNVVFICSRPAVWDSLKPICEAFIRDKRFNVKILTYHEDIFFTQNKTQSTENVVFDFFNDSVPCRVINGYNKARGTWTDLKDIEPDYVFFQTPYNNHRPDIWGSSVVSSYAKVCFINYGISTFRGEQTEVTVQYDFFKDVFATFTQTEEYHNYLTNFFQTKPQLLTSELHLVGEARFEVMQKISSPESDLWAYPKSAEKMRVIWTPRWSRIFGHSCFLEYKDKFMDLARQDKSLDFICRPHPLTFPEHLARGFLTEKDLKDYTDAFMQIENANLDYSGEYQSTLLSSSVLVTDISSIVHEYAFTCKPVIYCHRVDSFNAHSAELAKGFYWANNWDEVVKFLNMLKRGEDPLYEKRKEIFKRIYYMPPEGVGEKVKNYITEHFFHSVTTHQQREDACAKK